LSEYILHLTQQHTGHWLSIQWWRLAKYAGMTNGDIVSNKFSMIAEKLGVEDYFFLFEMQGFSERRLLDNEKPAEIVASWKASGKDSKSKLVVKQQQTAIGKLL
jgi:hypothetical protein